MATRVRQSAEKTLLCATRLWGVAPTIATLRAGVRHVVRKQGFSLAQIDAAERKLVAKGLLVVGGSGTGKSVRLTDKAAKVSCATTKLSPWTNKGYPGASLAGRRRR